MPRTKCVSPLNSPGGPPLEKLTSDMITIYQFINDFDSNTRKDKWNSGDVLHDEFDRSQGTGYKWLGKSIFKEFTEDGQVVYEHGISEDAIRPRALASHVAPTATERALHNMTHLPFRSWCAVCAKAKSKSYEHRRLKLKSPLVQIDCAFWVDSSGA